MYPFLQLLPTGRGHLLVCIHYHLHYAHAPSLYMMIIKIGISRYLPKANVYVIKNTKKSHSNISRPVYAFKINHKLNKTILSQLTPCYLSLVQTYKPGEIKFRYYLLLHFRFSSVNSVDMVLQYNISSPEKLVPPLECACVQRIFKSYP